MEALLELHYNEDQSLVYDISDALTAWYGMQSFYYGIIFTYIDIPPTDF